MGVYLLSREEKVAKVKDIVAVRMAKETIKEVWKKPQKIIKKPEGHRFKPKQTQTDLNEHKLTLMNPPSICWGFTPSSQKQG